MANIHYIFVQILTLLRYLKTKTQRGNVEMDLSIYTPKIAEYNETKKLDFVCIIN